MPDFGSHDEGTRVRGNHSSGGTHRCEKTQDHRGKVEALAIGVQCMAEEDRGAVEITHNPEMNRDNRYDLPAIYNNIIIQ